MNNYRLSGNGAIAVARLCAVVAVVALACVVPVAADVCNLGFEDGVVSPWVAFNSVGTTNVTIQTAARTGSYCVRLEQTTAGNKGGVYLRFPVTPGQTYSISAYCVSSSANNAARMRVDAAGGTNYNTYTAQASQGVQASYTLMNCGTVTATGNYITIFLAQESAASNVRYAHFDDVAVVPAAPGSASVAPSTIAYGGTASFSVSGAYGTRVGWYREPACTTFVGSGNPFVLTGITSTTTLYARNEVTCGAEVTGYSTTPSSASATVTVSECTPPAAPTNVSANPASVNCGQSSTLSASVESGCTVDWYTGSCGGTLVGSGASLVVSPTNTTAYYPRARRTSDGCLSTSCGSSVTVTTPASPSAPTSASASPSTISPGQSSTLSASVESGCTVDWYAGSCGGTLVGSGTSLVVTPGSTTAYYPRARNTTTGCTSASCGGTVTVTVGVPPSSVRFVKPHVGGVHDGLSWATAFDTVQEAVNVASSGEEVWVAAGVYIENVVLKSGVAVYGGFAGTETARSQRNWTANVTVLDGDGGGSVVEVVRDATNATRIDGFTIRNGSAITGGGIYCNQGASPVIVNNIITGNQAQFDGGGVFCNLGSAAVIASNRIVSNSALTAGGGVRSTTGAAVIANNIIAANSAQIGGAVACGDSSTSSTASHEYVVNNTMVSNAATSAGGAIYCYGASSASVSNNIIYYNSSGIRKASGAGVLSLKKNNVYANVSYNYSGVSAGATDISSDPLLAGAGYGNLHIQPSSPCRNAGDNTQVISGYLDVDNQTRIQNSTVDIGADESDGTTWTAAPLIVRVSTTGSGVFERGKRSCEEPCAEGIQAPKHAPIAFHPSARGVPASDGHVDVGIRKRGYELRDLLRRVGEVSVHDDEDFAAGFPHAAEDRAREPPFPAAQEEPEGVVLPKLLACFFGPVAAIVIDDEDLAPDLRALESLRYAGDEDREVRGLAVGGHDDGDPRRGASSASFAFRFSPSGEAIGAAACHGGSEVRFVRPHPSDARATSRMLGSDRSVEKYLTARFGASIRVPARVVSLAVFSRRARANCECGSRSSHFWRWLSATCRGGGSPSRPTHRLRDGSS